MPSVLETVDKTSGALSASQVVNSEITKVISELWCYQNMLPQERGNEKEFIEHLRSDLLDLRLYLDRHFQYKEGEK